jgi:uncharacterized small protein (DUF1192 family)
MGVFDDEPVRPSSVHAIGQDLSLLSVDEIRNRIGLLQSEIARLEAELDAKGASKDAAEAFFRRPQS